MSSKEKQNCYSVMLEMFLILTPVTLFCLWVMGFDSLSYISKLLLVVGSIFSAIWIATSTQPRH